VLGKIKVKARGLTLLLVFKMKAHNSKSTIEPVSEVGSAAAGASWLAAAASMVTSVVAAMEGWAWSAAWAGSTTEDKGKQIVKGTAVTIPSSFSESKFKFSKRGPVGEGCWASVVAAAVSVTTSVAAAVSLMSMAALAASGTGTG
jgi:hypothetical protein